MLGYVRVISVIIQIGLKCLNHRDLLLASVGCATNGFVIAYARVKLYSGVV